jgi:hypothetical protein
MRRSGLLIPVFFLFSQAIYAQSLVGTWESNHPLLRMVHFSITFGSDMTYKIDCALGHTTGTYTVTEDTIHFSPTKSTISAGNVGSIQVYPYAFTGENTFSMDENGTKVELSRIKT